MKRILYIVSMCVFALGLLSGCGGEFAEEMEAGKDASKALTGAAVSGQAVSGQAVSGQSIQTDEERADSKQEGLRGALNSRYCTERYYYKLLYDDEKYIAQISLETGKEKKIWVKELCQVVCVEKEALYCIKFPDDEYDFYSLWQIPIECHEDGSEEVKTDREEMVTGLEDIYYEEDHIYDDIYADDTYIVYSGEKDNEATVIRYEWESGKKVSMPVTKEAREYMSMDIERIYRRGDCLEVVTAGGIVTWDVRTGSVSVCSDKNLLEYHRDIDDELVSTERVCFYMAGDNAWDILRIDMETKKKTDFVSEKELWGVLETETGIQKKQVESLCVAELFYDENCLYIELEVEYEKEGKTYDHDIILSRGDTEGAPLQFENALSEHLWDDRSYCYGISQGTAKVCWDETEDSEEIIIIYDLYTGKTRPPSWKDDLIFG